MKLALPVPARLLACSFAPRPPEPSNASKGVAHISGVRPKHMRSLVPLRHLDWVYPSRCFHFLPPPNRSLYVRHTLLPTVPALSHLISLVVPPHTHFPPGDDSRRLLLPPCRSLCRFLERHARRRFNFIGREQSDRGREPYTKSIGKKTKAVIRRERERERNFGGADTPSHGQRGDERCLREGHAA